jgi:hypothetical protein
MEANCSEQTAQLLACTIAPTASAFPLADGPLSCRARLFFSVLISERSPNPLNISACAAVDGSVSGWALPNTQALPGSAGQWRRCPSRIGRTKFPALWLLAWCRRQKHVLPFGWAHRKSLVSSTPTSCLAHCPSTHLCLPGATPSALCIGAFKSTSSFNNQPLFAASEIFLPAGSTNYLSRQCLKPCICICTQQAA